MNGVALENGVEGHNKYVSQTPVLKELYNGPKVVTDSEVLVNY